MSLGAQIGAEGGPRKVTASQIRAEADKKVAKAYAEASATLATAPGTLGISPMASAESTDS